ncbi:MAG: enoyl-CoA hydratase/isomerase family protein [Actinobacteria bacterium]|nr:enoyl-CoA hydratase/isomerase family protein [Actinomycetota bacterium]
MSLVRLERDGALARITLDRPDARNALSVELCHDIVSALESVESDARAVVVAGEGKVFCSGADFAAVSGPGAAEFLPAFENMLETVARFRLPTIARIHGAALGGGLQLATVCDFRVAAVDAKLGIPSSKLGIVINYENVQRLVLLAGSAVTKEVLMTGRTYSGAEAKDAGLIHRAVAAHELDPATNELATTLASNAPLSVQGVKRAIQVVTDTMADARSTNAAAVAEIDTLVAEAYASQDLQEGLTAMSEKRHPHFKGH